MIEIVKMMWAMPWYKVILTHVMNTAVLVIKIWPIYVLGAVIWICKIYYDL